MVCFRGHKGKKSQPHRDAKSRVRASGRMTFLICNTVTCAAARHERAAGFLHNTRLWNPRQRKTQCPSLRLHIWMPAAANLDVSSFESGSHSCNRRRCVGRGPHNCRNSYSGLALGGQRRWSHSCLFQGPLDSGVHSFVIRMIGPPLQHLPACTTYLPAAYSSEKLHPLPGTCSHGSEP